MIRPVVSLHAAERTWVGAGNGVGVKMRVAVGEAATDEADETLDAALLADETALDDDDDDATATVVAVGDTEATRVSVFCGITVAVAIAMGVDDGLTEADDSDDDDDDDGAVVAVGVEHAASTIKINASAQVPNSLVISFARSNRRMAIDLLHIGSSTP